MGSSGYSDDIYRTSMSAKAARGTGAFDHDHAIRSGSVAAAVHDILNPKIPNKAGKLIRECFDSDTHPESVAIAVLFDVTGSMLEVPKLFIQKLPKLMAGLVKKGYIEHPAVLFGAIGDAYSDQSPLQIGQFESGNELDESLGKVHLEGNGGGQDMESYDLGLYYMARHTDLDCVKKRGKKGYLFLLGDERLYPHVSKEQVKRLIGDDLESDIPVEKILDEVREKFEVFWIMPGGTNHWGDLSVEKPIQRIFGERWLKLEDPADVCELIISAVGVTEGYDINDIASTLKSVGATKDSVDRATAAIVPYASTTSALAKKSTVDGALVASGTTDATERL